MVADIGAGSGWFTIRLARRVGPQGLVYAEDVQKEMINAISRRVGREGLNNVKPVLGLKNDPRLPAASLDAVLMVDAYHEVEDRVTMLVEPGEGAEAAGTASASSISGSTAPAPALAPKSASAPMSSSTTRRRPG